jgi:hypothetical protein
VLDRNIRIWGKAIINGNCVIEDNVRIGHPNPREFSQAIQNWFRKSSRPLNRDQVAGADTTIADHLDMSSTVYDKWKPLFSPETDWMLPPGTAKAGIEAHKKGLDIDAASML